jgi:hypothetical protein
MCLLFLKLEKKQEAFGYVKLKFLGGALPCVVTVFVVLAKNAMMAMCRNMMVAALCAQLKTNGIALGAHPHRVTFAIPQYVTMSATLTDFVRMEALGQSVANVNMVTTVMIAMLVALGKMLTLLWKSEVMVLNSTTILGGKSTGIQRICTHIPGPRK